MSYNLRTFIREHLVDEVPDEMSACLDCGAIQCRDGRYEDCPNRLARAAALKALHPAAEQQSLAAS
jgi:hypothetical protein